MRNARNLWTIAGVSLLVHGCAGSGADGMTQTLTAEAEIGATFTVGTCSLSPAGSITLTGELALAGLDARLIFRNNQKGTHERTDDVTATTVVIPADQTIVIPTPSLQGPPSPAPVIFVQFIDANGNPIGGEIDLGACDSAGFPASANVSLATTVTLTVSMAGCTNHPGPTITVSGAVEFAGLSARIEVRAADGTTAGAIVTAADVVALQAGETHSIPKQPSRGGVGGNPWIYAQLVDADGAPLTDELFVGRCVQD